MCSPCSARLTSNWNSLLASSIVLPPVSQRMPRFSLCCPHPHNPPRTAPAPSESASAHGPQAPALDTHKPMHKMDAFRPFPCPALALPPGHRWNPILSIINTGKANADVTRKSPASRPESAQIVDNAAPAGGTTGAGYHCGSLLSYQYGGLLCSCAGFVSGASQRILSMAGTPCARVSVARGGRAVLLVGGTAMAAYMNLPTLVSMPAPLTQMQQVFAGGGGEGGGGLGLHAVAGREAALCVYWCSSVAPQLEHAPAAALRLPSHPPQQPAEHTWQAAA